MRPSQLRIARRPAVGLFVLIVALLWSARVRADDSLLPPEIEAAIHLKVLSFDSALADRPGDRVMIAVVHDPADPESVKQGAVMRAAFATLAKKVSVQNKRVSIVGIAYNPSSLTGDLADQRADVVYVCAGVQRDAVAAIVAASRPRSAPTLTDTRQGLQWGLAIGVVRADDKPKIIVNLAAVKYIGMKLDPALLRLAEVLK